MQSVQLRPNEDASAFKKSGRPQGGMGDDADEQKVRVHL